MPYMCPLLVRVRVSYLSLALADVQTRTTAVRRMNYFGTLWRLLPYDDPSVSMFLSRDLDDCLDADSRELIAKWEQDAALYAHRQAEEDRYLVNAGWFGLKHGALPEGWSMKDNVARWCLRAQGGKPDLGYCTDERFLSEVVWPLVGEGHPHGGVALGHSRPGLENYEAKWREFMKLPEADVRPVDCIDHWR